MTFVPLTTASVIRAIYDLGDRHGGRWPTVPDIAGYLRSDEPEVRACLRELRAQRLFTDRRRKGRTVWMPWREA